MKRYLGTLTPDGMISTRETREQMTRFCMQARGECGHVFELDGGVIVVEPIETPDGIKEQPIIEIETAKTEEQ